MPPPLRLPSSIGRIRGVAGGPEWIDSLPGLIDECARRWSLELGDPYPGSYVSVVLPVIGGVEPAVLKVQFPHRESEHEAEALRSWNGNGSVRLIDHDPGRHALLIERCEPGTHLSERDPSDALDVFVGLLPRLWISVKGPFRSLDDEATEWADDLRGMWERAGRPFEGSLVEDALAALRDVIGSSREAVLLHQDLHADNVLRSSREPWLVIDPKPLVGDPAFSVAPIVRSFEMGHSRRDAVYRLDRLTDELGLDRDRALSWTVGQTLAWAFEGGGAIDAHVETARWLVRST
jgi:streptomycin 6-kinase